MTSASNTEGPFSQSFDARVAQIQSHFCIPGLSISVVDGEQTFSKGYGKASLRENVPATPETLYYTGSTTKSFTAAAVLRRIELSEDTTRPLSLKTKIVDLLGDDFVLHDDYATQNTSLEDALCHRTGMPRHDSSVGGPNEIIKAIVRRLRYFPMTAKLGERWQYCNLMYHVLSYCLETVSEQSLESFWRQHICEPLGMSSTVFSDVEAEAMAAESKTRLATGYCWSGETQTFVEMPFMADNHIHKGAGAIISNVTDYAVYLRAMIAQDSRILSRKSFTELRAPRIPVIFEGQPEAFTGPRMYGLGWHSAVYHGHQMFFHGGGMIGFAAEIAYLPSLNNGVGITIFTNAENMGNKGAQVLLYDLLDTMIGVPEEQRFDWLGYWSEVEDKRIEKLNDFDGAVKSLYPDLGPNSKPLPLPLPLSAYVGTYRSPGYRSLKVVTELDEERPLGSGKTVEKLFVNAFQKTWRHKLRFEHVSGNNFIIWMSPPQPANGSFLNLVMPGKFEISPSGEVRKMMIDYDDGGIWFDRVFDNLAS